MIENKVSCITITRNRVDYLRKCIRYFQEQTYSNKELVIVYYNTDKETEKFLKEETTDIDNIVICKHVEEKGIELGAIRNYGISKASGEWICTWDDDDYFSPNRIQNQFDFCKKNNLSSCSLRALLIFSEKHQEVHLTNERDEGWENSIFAKKTIMPKYKNLPRMEDTPVLMKLSKMVDFGTLFDPDLYVYRLHDHNISTGRHLDTIFENSFELSIDKQREIKKLIEWI